MSNNDENKYIGGGVAIGIYKDLIFRDVSSKIPQSILESLELIAVQIQHQELKLFLINVYVSNNHRLKKHLSQLNEWLIDLHTTSPDSLIIVCGDFNQKSQPLTNLNNLNTNQENTFRRLRKNNWTYSITDHVLSNSILNCSWSQSWNEFSDHALIILDFELNNSKPQDSRLKIPVKSEAFNLCSFAE